MPLHLPNVRGARRLADALNATEQILGRDPVRQVTMSAGHRMLVDRRSTTERGPFYLRTYDQQKIELLRRFIEPGTAVLDIGANVGFFTVPLGIFVRDQRRFGRVFAFEPVPGNRDRLQENILINALDETVTIIPAALSSKPGTVEISLREDFQNGSRTGNAAIVISTEDNLFETTRIVTMRLDDYVAHEIALPISVIKIDTEGHEDEVLAGGNETIARNRPVILMEVEPNYYERKGVDFYERVRAVLPPDYRFLAVGLHRQSVLRPLGTRLSFTEIRDRPSFMRPQDVLLLPPGRHV
ncbi:FkbM family methyltransferase [Methylobacterium sp. CB376]|uniref:FkbM family methyltransferase n=1 Tax=unclassified Methylobacterium TaxID=2615210 RepID=UPI000152D11A|nr:MULTISPECIES: FkbM family methyltransferase [Methylobacterium]WFT82893.1 FkbM family methyltransferase [Methylobacterium nodulans]